MKEALDNAREELKRVDHLIYVSLKYTRTVDVLMSIVNRMIDAYDFLMDALLRLALEQEKILDVPEKPLQKVSLASEIYKDQVIDDNIQTYRLFRKLTRSEFRREREYRRHVNMKSTVDDEIVNINIDNITEYYMVLKEFLSYIDNLIEGKEE